MHTQKELQTIWNAVPPDYYQNGVKNNILQRLWHTGKLHAVSSFISTPPRRILDAGCASGWFLSQLHKNYPESYAQGIDVYDKAIAYAKRKYPSLHFVTGDIHTLPFPSASYDLVICNEVLEHVVSPSLVLSEIKRVMTPGGTAIIEMDTGNWLFRLVWHWWTHMRHGVWEDAHIQIFNEKRLQKEIETAGFTIQKTKHFNVGMAVAFCVTKQTKKKA